MTDCQIPYADRCCCTCRFQANLCRIETPLARIGWACVGWLFLEGRDAVHAKRGPHGLCELHEPIEKKGPSNG